jgi:hypothetical protein
MVELVVWDKDMLTKGYLGEVVQGGGRLGFWV